MQIVINAGGMGTRLWPISSSNLPKQFCKLVDDKTLLQNTYSRLRKKFSKENIWISINEEHQSVVIEQLPEIPLQNILTEPERRDTFPAVSAHAALIAGKTSYDEEIIFVGSDHIIETAEQYNKSLELIIDGLSKNKFSIIVAGVKPTFPSTQFGYIEINKSDIQKSFQEPVKVNSFHEKPNYEKASDFLEEGCYSWNIALFAFKFSTLLKILQSVQPYAVFPLKEISQAGVIDSAHFQKLKKDSFDFVVLERTSNLGMITMNLDTWEDIGNYESLGKYIPEVANFSKQNDTKPKQIQISGQNNKIRTDNPNKKIALVGVSDLVIVENDNGLLIIDPSKSSEVKAIAKYFDNL